MSKQVITCATRTRSYRNQPMQLEVGGELSNSLTTVTKDFLAMINEEEKKIEDMTPEELSESIKAKELRIRKLTPTECYYLMGFEKADIDKCIAAGVSNSQLYKTAGNSICVNCLEMIFGQMLSGREDDWKAHWVDRNPYARCENCGCEDCKRSEPDEGFRCYESAAK